MNWVTKVNPTIFQPKKSPRRRGLETGEDAVLSVAWAKRRTIQDGLPPACSDLAGSAGSFAPGERFEGPLQQDRTGHDAQPPGIQFQCRERRRGDLIEHTMTTSFAHNRVLHWY